MFCANCGSSFEGNPKFCPVCGAMIKADAPQTNPTSEQPASSQLKNTFSNAPANQRPEYVQPAQAPNNFQFREQPNNTQVFQNTFAPAATPKAKKKPFKNPKVWIVSAIIAVLVAVLAIFNAGKIGNFFVKLFTSDEGYVQHVHEKAAEDLSGNFTSLYSSFKKTLSSLNGEGGGDTAAKGDIKIEVGEKLITFVSDQTGTDFSWVKSAAVEYDINMKNGMYQIDLAVVLNSVKFVTAQVIVDMADTQMIYITSEELLDTYISMPFELDQNAQASMALIGEVASALPDEEVMEKLINRYISVALDQIEDVEKENDTVEVGDVKAKYEKYTVTVDGDLVADMLEAILEEASDDDDIKDIIEALVPMIAGQEADAKEIVNAFEDGLDDAIDNIDGDMFGDFEFDYSFWVNNEGDIIGFEIEIGGGTISMVAPEKGKKSAFEFKIEPPEGEESVVFSGEAETSGGKKNGKYKLKAADYEIITVELIDYDVKLGEKGYFNGAIEISPSDEAMGMLSTELINGSIPEELANLITDGISIRLDIATSEKEVSYGVSLLSGKEKLITLSTSSKLTDASSVNVPDSSINVEEVKSPEQLGLDPEKLLETLTSKLKEAGIPEEILELITNNTGAVRPNAARPEYSGF